jgi:hypothetical protein
VFTSVIRTGDKIMEDYMGRACSIHGIIKSDKDFSQKF